MPAKLIHCKVCDAEIAANAKSCPKCGARNKKPLYRKLWFWVLLVIIAIGVVGGSSSVPEKVESEPVQELAAQKTEEKQSIQNEAANTAEKSKEEIKSVKKTEKIPTEYNNALKKAKTYSDMMNMSKKGIYNQLVSEYGEKFSEDAAQYAIDHLDANFNENALKKAKTYQNTMNMSKSAIYDQLVSDFGEGFTESEAQYAIDHLD